MKPIIFLTLTAALCLSSCKEKAAETPTEPEAAAAPSAPAGPEHSSSNLSTSDTLRLGSHRYVVQLTRFEDTSLPTVRDEMDTEFYDNRTTVSVTRDSEEVYSRTFSKTDFLEKTAEKDRQMGVFLGMALRPERCTPDRLVFAAQVGQPGLEGEGSGFKVTLSLSDFSYGLEREQILDTNRSDMEAEE